MGSQNFDFIRVETQFFGRDLGKNCFLTGPRVAPAEPDSYTAVREKIDRIIRSICPVETIRTTGMNTACDADTPPRAPYSLLLVPTYRIAYRIETFGESG